MRSKAFKLIILKITKSFKTEELLWMQMEVEPECLIGATDCLDMTKKLWMKSKIYKFRNKEEIKNGEDNYIRDSTRKDKDENLNVLK